MKVLEKEVIIFKAPHDGNESNNEDAYQNCLSSAGLIPHLIPVLDFEFFNLDVLYEKLTSPRKYSGLIFTSPRSAKAVSQCLKDRSLKDLGWKSSFVVGEATGEIVKEQLGIDVQGSKSGNIAALVDYITSGMNSTHLEKPILCPCGELALQQGNHLKLRLIEVGIELDSIPVYKTRQHPELEMYLQKVTVLGVPQFVVFFSPSGVKFALPIMQKLSIKTSLLKIVAIGPTTFKALVDAKLSVWSVAEKPSPQHLVSAILQPPELGL